MRTRLVLLIIVTIVLATLLAGGMCEARGLGGSCHHGSVHAAPHAGHVYATPLPVHGGYRAPAAKSSYAYGWFGVTPRRHKGVHHGYYNNYTQWSYR